MTSAGHSSSCLPTPTVSTLATGSDFTTSRCTCSAAPVAFSARKPSSISVTASFGRNGSAATTAAPGSSLTSSGPDDTTGTINTADFTPRRGSEEATETAGAR